MLWLIGTGLSENSWSFVSVKGLPTWTRHLCRRSWVCLYLPKLSVKQPSTLKRKTIYSPFTAAQLGLSRPRDPIWGSLNLCWPVWVTCTTQKEVCAWSNLLVFFNALNFRGQNTIKKKKVNLIGGFQKISKYHPWDFVPSKTATNPNNSNETSSFTATTYVTLCQATFRL